MASNTSLILTDDWLKTDLLISLNIPSTSEEMDRLIKNGLYKIGKYYYYFTEYGDLLRQGSFDYKGKTYYTNWHGVVNIKDEEVTP